MEQAIEKEGWKIERVWKDIRGLVEIIATRVIRLVPYDWSVESADPVRDSIEVLNCASEMSDRALEELRRVIDLSDEERPSSLEGLAAFIEVRLRLEELSYACRSVVRDMRVIERAHGTGEYTAYLNHGGTLSGRAGGLGCFKMLESLAGAVARKCDGDTHADFSLFDGMFNDFEQEYDRPLHTHREVGWVVPELAAEVERHAERLATYDSIVERADEMIRNAAADGEHHPSYQAEWAAVRAIAAGNRSIVNDPEDTIVTMRRGRRVAPSALAPVQMPGRLPYSTDRYLFPKTYYLRHGGMLRCTSDGLCASARRACNYGGVGGLVMKYHSEEEQHSSEDWVVSQLGDCPSNLREVSWTQIREIGHILASTAGLRGHADTLGREAVAWMQGNLSQETCNLVLAQTHGRATQAYGLSGDLGGFLRKLAIRTLKSTHAGGLTIRIGDETLYLAGISIKNGTKAGLPYQRQSMRVITGAPDVYEAAMGAGIRMSDVLEGMWCLREVKQYIAATEGRFGTYISPWLEETVVKVQPMLSDRVIVGNDRGELCP